MILLRIPFSNEARSTHVVDHQIPQPSCLFFPDSSPIGLLAAPSGLEKVGQGLVQGGWNTTETEDLFGALGFCWFMQRFMLGVVE